MKQKCLNQSEITQTVIQNYADQCAACDQCSYRLHVTAVGMTLLIWVKSHYYQVLAPKQTAQHKVSDSNDTSIHIHFVDDRGLEHQIRKVLLYRQFYANICCQK